VVIAGSASDEAFAGIFGPAGFDAVDSCERTKEFVGGNEMVGVVIIEAVEGDGRGGDNVREDWVGKGVLSQKSKVFGGTDMAGRFDSRDVFELGVGKVKSMSFLVHGINKA